MTSCLRSSSNIVKFSSRGLQAAARTPFKPQPFAPGLSATSVRRCARSYATGKPDNPKEPNDKKAGSEKAASHGDQKKAKGAGKSAPGFEHLYNQKSPVSKPSEGLNNEPLSQASKLTPEDEKVLSELLGLIRAGMGNRETEVFDRAFEELRRHGIPDDLRKIMNVYKGSASFDLATAAAIVRIFNGLGRKNAELKTSRPSKDPTSQPRAKAGTGDPGPQNKEDRKEKSNETGGGFFNGSQNVGGFKIDTGTFLTAAFVSYMLYRSISPGENSKEITWQEFRTAYLEKGLVEKLIVLNRKQVKVILNRENVRSIYGDSPAANPNFYYNFSIGDVMTFERHVDEAQELLGIPSSQRIPIQYDDPTSWVSVLLQLAPTLLLLGIPFLLIRRSQGGAGGAGGIFGMGKSRAKRFNHETDVKVAFKDVAGMDEAKEEIMEFVSFLKEPSMYQKLGAKIPRGAILSGPPGTGKTLLAKATAGESQVPFFSVSGSEFVEMFVGVGASRVRDLFATARKSTPCIIFIDEIDAIGKSRGKNNFSGGNDEREATLNQILTEMDGFNTSEQVVVLAGTNRADVLDKALMRPGRFDRHISIDKPTMEGRKQIFAVHLKNIVTKEEQEHLRGRLAALTPGFSGADIANCVNEAALIAARRKADDVNMKHFEDAIERVIGGLEKKSMVLKPEEKRVVAYHEAGHAICGWFFKYADPLLKVSIIPRGSGALGYAQYLPSGETYLMNVNQLMDRMAMTLAGRVSEELHFETVTSGASDDFNKVTRMATAMVTKWGMSSKVGYLYYDDDPQQQLHRPFSETTSAKIDQEVRRIIDEAYKQCKDLLMEKKKEIGVVAEELLKKEVLNRDDLVRLLGVRPFEPDQSFEQYFGGGKGDREGTPGSTPDSPPPGPNTPGSSIPPSGGIEGPAPTIMRKAEDRF